MAHTYGTQKAKLHSSDVVLVPTYCGKNVGKHAGVECTCSLRTCAGLAGRVSQNERGHHRTEVELKEPSMYSSGPSK